MDVMISGPFNFEIEGDIVYVTMSRGVTGVERLALKRHDAYAALAFYERVVEALDGPQGGADVIPMKKAGG